MTNAQSDATAHVSRRLECMTMEQWYVCSDGSVIGPVGAELIVRGIEAGRVPASALVCRVGCTTWDALLSIPEFAEAAVTKSAAILVASGAFAAPAPPLAALSAPRLLRLGLSPAGSHAGYPAHGHMAGQPPRARAGRTKVYAGVGAAVAVLVIAGAAWLVFRTDPWMPVRQQARNALVSLLAKDEITPDTGELSALESTCAARAAVVSASGGNTAAPAELLHLGAACDRLPVVLAAGGLAVPDPPAEPSEPKYVAPKYSGAWKLRGEFVQLDDGLLVQREERFYYLPGATTVQGGRSGRVWGYVRPLHQSLTVAGRTVNLLEHVPASAFSADQAAHGKATAEAKAAFEQAALEYSAAKAAYPEKLASYDSLSRRVRSGREAAGTLEAQLRALAGDLGVVVARSPGSD